MKTNFKKIAVIISLLAFMLIAFSAGVNADNQITQLPVSPTWTAFSPAGATAYGKMTSTYVNNYWAYYAETKTLKFFAAKNSGYNEVGYLSNCDDGTGWTPYLKKIEHVVIGPSIHKLTAGFATGMTNLKDIEMTANITQASGTFVDAPNLTTIFITGMEKVEGQAMLASARSNFKLNFSGTSVKSIHMGSSSWTFVGNITPGPKTSTLILDAPTDAIIAYARENYLNIKDSGGKVYGEWYVAVPEGLPFCGDTAVFNFDATTGTLSILGKGAVGDTANYWGGGSKNQFWYDIKYDIKHVIVGDYITAIGKYAFTECENLETVELPAKDGFVILNAVFEDCYNLKSVYIRGNQPIEGTADVSIIHEFESYTFADCFLIANAVINEKVKKIGSSVFDNCVNLQNIYGVPGSFAEEYATKNELTFFDKAANTPRPIKIGSSTEITEPAAPETEAPVVPETTVSIATDVPEDIATEAPWDDAADAAEGSFSIVARPVEPGMIITKPQLTVDDAENSAEGGSSLIPIIIVIVVIIAVAAFLNRDHQLKEEVENKEENNSSLD